MKQKMTKPQKKGKKKKQQCNRVMKLSLFNFMLMINSFCARNLLF